MKYNLKEIFKGITPDNIKDIPVIKDSMNIFIEILEERAKESIDIKSYTENKKIRKELFKTYLSDLYEVLDGIKDNQKLIDFIASRNEVYNNIDDYEFVSREVLEDMLNRISDEHFMAFRNFREKKGTIEAIRYIFHLIATLVNSPEGVDYIIIEGEDPFELGIEGTLPPEFYYYLIAPLAHPAGFTFAYAQAVVWELIDYFFPIENIYTVRALDVNCISIDPITQRTTKTSTSFKDRRVIDIRRSAYLWPRSLKIYFGGEHEGEYLENLTYANGHSTVELKDSNDRTILTFGDYCTIYEVIELVIKQNNDFDVMDTELISFLRSSYNTVWNPETRELQELDDSVVQDHIERVEAYYGEVKSPFMSWERFPYWSVIGPDDKKWDNWVGNCLPDSIIETPEVYQAERVSGSGRGLINAYDNYPETLIGGDHLYISGKFERITGQISATINDIPERYNKYESKFEVLDKEQVLYGLVEYNNETLLLINPSRPDLDHAYVSGDAYNLNYITRIRDVNTFIIEDSITSHIFPNVDLTNSELLINAFIIRDDGYSVVYRDSYSNCHELLYDNPSKGFWDNSFHSESDKFEFGVFRNGLWLPDNNVNQPITIDIDDDYELSYEYMDRIGRIGNLDSSESGYIIGSEKNGMFVVFDENSDYLSDFSIEFNDNEDYGISYDSLLGEIIAFNQDSDYMSNYIEFNDNEDYGISYDSLTQQEVIAFNQDSDYFGDFSIGFNDSINDDYRLSYEYMHWIGRIGHLDDSDAGFIIGTEINDMFEVFDEVSDDIFYIEYK